MAHSPSRCSWNRSVSLAISFLGALFNFAFAVQLLSAWRSLKWEKESEWEGSENPWTRDGVQLVWGLLSAYFAVAATVCVAGFVGIAKSIPAYVRFYRDYSIADFAFCSFLTLLGSYAAFRTASVRTIICEELSRQPDLMRSMEAGMGLSLENCEGWFERAVMLGVVGMIVLIVVRLHFLIALSGYYRQMVRGCSAGALPMHMLWRSSSSSAASCGSASGSSAASVCAPLPHQRQQHIYLLPRQSPQPGDDDVLVYAPVPLSTLSPQQAHDLRASATQAWISRTAPLSSDHSNSTGSGRRHGHRRHGSKDGGSVTGRICLPVSPQEGLLPMYEESVKA